MTEIEQEKVKRLLVGGPFDGEEVEVREEVKQLMVPFGWSGPYSTAVYALEHERLVWVRNWGPERAQEKPYTEAEEKRLRNALLDKWMEELGLVRPGKG